MDGLARTAEFFASARTGRRRHRHPGSHLNVRILVLGADGYLGWPTALHLSAKGHDVVAVDNLVRRRWDRRCGTHSLVPIASMERRVERWKELSGRRSPGGSSTSATPTR